MPLGEFLRIRERYPLRHRQDDVAARVTHAQGQTPRRMRAAQFDAVHVARMLDVYVMNGSRQRGAANRSAPDHPKVYRLIDAGQSVGWIIPPPSW